MFKKATNYVGLGNTLVQIIGDAEKSILMKVAVMQPYLFPYLGYFHLLDAVDKFVVLDDVKYPKNGWVNRNRILVNGSPIWFTVPVSSTSELISEKQYLINEQGIKKLQETLVRSYARSPNLRTVLPWLENLAKSNQDGVVESNIILLKKTMELLGMKIPEIITSSELKIDKKLTGERKILEICYLFGAETYVNLPGGVNLYDQKNFASRGIRLAFIQSNFYPYFQKAEAFVPRMSILDFLLSQSTNYKDWISAANCYSLSE